jgi:formate/nitrite transporter FocA (FNT family)
MPADQKNPDVGTYTLNPRERQEAERRSAPHVAVVHEAIRLEGEEELERSPQALGWSGLAAGLSMGFSLLAQGFLHAALPDTDWSVLIVKFGYAVGFLVVILGRQQLFTENTLTPVLPLLHDFRGKIGKAAKLWGVVLFGNLVGAGLFAWALSVAPSFDADMQRAFLEIARDVYRGDFLATFVAALYAGWLIALMVWMLPFAEGGRIAVIVVVTYVIGLGHLDHSIAGSAEVLYLVAMGEVGFLSYLTHFLAPAVLGNFIGGVVFVALLNHAQVTHNDR